MIKEAINKLSLSEDLTIIETKEVFDEIIQGLADDTLISSFVTALYSKRPSVDELVGGISSAFESVKKINLPIDAENLLENVQFGELDGILDVSLAVDLVCASVGLGAAKYAFNSPFEINKTFKNAKQLGIEPVFDVELYKDNFEKSNFGYLYLSSCEPYYKYCKDVARKLPFNSVLNVIEKMLNPYGAKNKIIGVKTNEMVEQFAKVCLQLNYSNSMLLCSDDSLPCASISGKTFIAEAWKNKIFTYVLTPELLGLKNGNFDDVKVENSEHNAQILLDLFQNKMDNGTIFDFVVLNSALALYISKKANSLIDAVDLARKTIKDGLAYEKILQLRKIYS